MATCEPDSGQTVTLVALSVTLFIICVVLAILLLRDRFFSGCCSKKVHPASQRRPRDVPRHVWAIFSEYDLDKSGSIDSIELRHALNSLGLHTRSEQAQNLLDRFDRNGDGSLDVHEFVHMVDKLREFQHGQEIVAVFNKHASRNRDGPRRITSYLSLHDAIIELGIELAEDRRTSAGHAVRDVLKRYGDSELELTDFANLIRTRPRDRARELVSPLLALSCL